MFAKKTQLACLTAGLLSVFALTGCKDGAAPQQAQRQMPPAEVVVKPVVLQDTVVDTVLSGRTNAYNIAEVRPQVNGILKKRLFKEGSEVKAGQPLYQIDDAVYKAQYDSAKAELERAQATLAQAKADAKRSGELVKIKAVSEQSNDAAQAALKTAQANVSSAKAALQTASINLDYTRVRSPISGRVSRSEVTEGALMSAYQGLMTTVQQLDPIYVDVTQTADDLLRIRREQSAGILKTDAQGNLAVKLTLSDGTTYKHVGKLTFTDVTVNESTGTVNVRAVFPNPERILMPGMYVRATLDEGLRKGAVLVDMQSVMRDQRGQPYVYVVNADNKVEVRNITTSRTVGTKWLVDSGLKAGDRVIYDGLIRVRPGATVAPKPYDDSMQLKGEPLFK